MTDFKPPKNAKEMRRLVTTAPDNVIRRHYQLQDEGFNEAWLIATLKQAKALEGTNLVISSVACKQNDDYSRLKKAVINATQNDRFKTDTKITPVSVELPGGGTLTPVLEPR